MIKALVKYIAFASIVVITVSAIFLAVIMIGAYVLDYEISEHTLGKMAIGFLIIALLVIIPRTILFAKVYSRLEVKEKRKRSSGKEGAGAFFESP